ncbi:beta-propeller domain-containing protein [Sorangium sp. So ce1182]|uniref:beta-propeller domain-containing protein n=1 Tax=Sorangium sp. So ce1182 TaxID=3133334 RepID=UPI003F63D3EB
MSIVFRACAGWVVLAATAASVGLAGCEGGTRGEGSSSPPEQTDFISGNPTAPRGGDPAGDGAGDPGPDSEGVGGGPDAAPVPPRGGAIAERALRDADIVQEKDGRLYAMSLYSGLSVIDASRRDELRLLGTRRMHNATPVAMYLRDGVVYALFTGWLHVVPDAQPGASHHEVTSHIEVLDVSDPAEILPVGSFDLPGKLTEARLAGDVLHAVTYEPGSCFECAVEPNITVTSLAVGDPADIALIERRRLIESAPSGYWGWPSVSVGDDRVYIASAAWNGGAEQGRATIQVIDISDPGGALVEGARVEVTGQIAGPWQVDEHDGVLRFVSLPGPWQPGAKPGIQTFSIVSSQDIAPLGATELDLPPAVELRSVHFDGDRAYAIAPQPITPVLTVDLSDPAHPAQVGGIAVPGSVFHLEPRGDRLFALGADPAAGERPLHVSLFDVSDLANPTTLERVAFGGRRARVVEERDRVHEALAFFDGLGTLAVPYREPSREAVPSDCSTTTTGIQLIDFTRDTLAKRGAAATRGQARRVLASGERLVAVSDLGVEAFGSEAGGAPAKVASIALAAFTSSTVAVGELVVRLGADTDAGGGAWLEIASAASPGLAEPIARLDHTALFGEVPACHSEFSRASLFAHGQHVYVLSPTPDYASTHLAIVDVGDPSAPRVVAQLELPFSPGALYYTDRLGAVVSASSPVVQAGSTLVIRRASDDGYYHDESARPPHEAWLELLDLADPLNPRHSSVELPEGAGHAGLQIDGTTVLLSRWVPLPDDASRARFYLDRVDVADPSSPVVRASVNVPGSPIAFDGASRRLLTMDYENVETPVVGREACARAFASNAAFTPEVAGDDAGPGVCRGTRRALKLLDLGDTSAQLRDERPVGDTVAVVQALAGEDRAFLSVEDGAPGAMPAILVAGGLREGSLKTATQELAGFNHRSSSLFLADGARLLVINNDDPALSVLDATDLTVLSFEKKSDLSAYVVHATLSGDRALCSSGRAGLEVVDVGP